MTFLTCPKCGRTYSAVDWVGHFAVVAPLIVAGLIAGANRSLAVFLLLVSVVVGLYLYFDHGRAPNKPGIWLSGKPLCSQCALEG